MTITALRKAHNARHRIAGDVQASLAAFESDLSRALSSGGALIQMLPDARSSADLSHTVGNDVVGHFIGALSALQGALVATSAGHAGLAALAGRLRIDVTAAGDKDELPPYRP